jgi:hypothetical protein
MAGVLCESSYIIKIKGCPCSGRVIEKPKNHLFFESYEHGPQVTCRDRQDSFVFEYPPKDTGIEYEWC